MGDSIDPDGVELQVLFKNSFIPEFLSKYLFQPLFHWNHQFEIAVWNAEARISIWYSNASPFGQWYIWCIPSLSGFLFQQLQLCRSRKCTKMETNGTKSGIYSYLLLIEMYMQYKSMCRVLLLSCALMQDWVGLTSGRVEKRHVDTYLFMCYERGNVEANYNY